MPALPTRRALFSVHDKTDLVPLAQAVRAAGGDLVSTGGTRAALEAAGLPVTDVAALTGFPELLGGRVKTLHPAVHAGLLARRSDPAHAEALAAHGITPIDLVVCNLYPFERVTARPGCTPEEAVENIDIGGVTLLRAAAKNHESVAAVTDPGQYAEVIDALRRHGGLPSALRRKLAAVAFRRTAEYDAQIAAWFAHPDEADGLSESLTLSFVRSRSLRYGENPHQPAAFYAEPGASARPCVASARVLHGKELSYNNLLDLDSALNLAREFDRPAAVVVKHNNPCGAAVGDSPDEAFGKAYEGDPLSAFGGILGFNREVDEATAEQVTEPNRFIECVIAPSYSPKAFEVLTTRPKWKASVRLLQTGPLAGPPLGYDYRRVDGGLLVQARDTAAETPQTWKVVTRRQPSTEELADLWFAWLVCKHVKSNAIVLAKGGQLVGVGAGQMSRVDSTQIAVRKAGGRANGAVLASDAFFPFRDNVDAAAAAGVTAVVQPGGSVRDAESVAACDEHGLAMAFTGVRHFRH